MSRAVKKYLEFHQHDPRRIATARADFKIPARAFCVGEAVHVLYASDKLNPTTGQDEGWIDYIHEHSAGVHTYRTDRAAAELGREHAVPAWLRNVSELVWLGKCLGYAYRDAAGDEIEGTGTEPLPGLYATPNGKGLLVIQGYSRVLTLMWGGKLGVEARGIVH